MSSESDSPSESPSESPEISDKEENNEDVADVGEFDTENESVDENEVVNVEEEKGEESENSGLDISSGEEVGEEKIEVQGEDDDLKILSGSDNMSLSDTEESFGEMMEIVQDEDEKLEVLKGLIDQKTDKGLKINRRGEFYFTETQLQYTLLSFMCVCFGCFTYSASMILGLIPIVTESFNQFWDFWWIFLLLITPVICCCMCFCCCFVCLKTYWVRVTFSDHNQLIYIQRGNLIPVLTSTKVVRYDKIDQIKCVEGIRTPWEEFIGRFHIGIKKSNGNTLIISTPYIKRKRCQKVAALMNECLQNHIHL